jgi:Arc/MetJ family transcription regulator
MRTTLTIDDDVAAQIERLCRDRNASLKAVINDALRAGLREMEPRRKRRRPHRTSSVSLGRPRLGNVDNVVEALALAEGDAFK